eukprot:7158952-Alexandrium_andersonii.AAC.2
MHCLTKRTDESCWNVGGLPVGRAGAPHHFGSFCLPARPPPQRGPESKTKAWREHRVRPGVERWCFQVGA